MLVERGDHLDPPRAVMDLVKEPPKEVVLVPQAMPPVENESGHEVGHSARSQVIQIGAQMKQGLALKPALPAPACQLHDSELNRIDEEDPKGPARHARQAPA